MIKRVSVIGLGKLGSPIAASFASRGYPTIGLDVDPALVAALKGHKAPVNETDLQKYIDMAPERITATNDWTEAIMESDVSFLVVPTPSGPDGAFSSKFVVDACEKIGAVLKNKKEFHLVSVVSTVMPGSSVKEIIPALERTSGKKAGKDFGYCYSPTLIALGSVIHDFLNPELVSIGEVDPQSGRLLEDFYRAMLLSKPQIHRVTPTEAELAKIAINTFVTTKISFANMLGMITDAMGVNVDHVTGILGSDSRIGKKYLRAGGSYGGPCFPRDNRALTRAAELAGVETYLPQATDKTNQQYIEIVARKAEKAIAQNLKGVVGVVGVAYKPNTEVVEEAMGLHLVKRLQKNGTRVMVYDPSAAHTVRAVFGDGVAHADSIESCIAGSDVIVVTNPYGAMAPHIQAAEAQGKTVIDCWRVRTA